MRTYSVNTDRDPDSIRKDASANRNSIVQKARKVLAVNPDASLTQIAQAAGLSRATLYRNFKDKHSIIHAVFHYNLDILEAYSNRIKGEEEHFFKLLEALIEHQVNYQSLASRLSEMEDGLIERVLNIFREPVAAAQAEGSLRADFSVDGDMILTLMMIGGALITATEEDRHSKAKRAMQLLMEGLRTK